MAETRSLTYARIGGTRESPLICRHRHILVEEAAACVPWRGEVYEEADDVIQGTFWTVSKETPMPGTAGSIERQSGCIFVGKSRSEIGALQMGAPFRGLHSHTV
jgi:hypothetical protein